MPPPTLEQRLAWRREQKDNPRGRGEIPSNQRQHWDGDSGGDRPEVRESEGSGRGDNEPTQESLDQASMRVRVRT